MRFDTTTLSRAWVRALALPVPGRFFFKSYDHGNRVSLPLEMDGNERQKGLESVNRSKDDDTKRSHELESHPQI